MYRYIFLYLMKPLNAIIIHLQNYTLMFITITSSLFSYISFLAYQVHILACFNNDYFLSSFCNYLITKLIMDEPIRFPTSLVKLELIFINSYLSCRGGYSLQSVIITLYNQLNYANLPFMIKPF